MRLAASLLAVAVAACGEDLSLDVQVRHPEGAAVASTVVSIYESSTATCKQIELGDLSAAELQAILVEERTDAGPLSGIARAGRKLVVARGFDAAGRLVTAGCTEKEAIAGRDAVAVETAFAARISIGAIAPGDLAIPITLTDAEGRALAGHPVTWRVYGPDGATPGTTGAALAPADDGGWELAAPTCTGDTGAAIVHPVPPSRVGGYAIAIRPSWPAQPTTLLTSFTRVAAALEPVTPKPAVTRPCAIRVAGAARRLVCLQLDGTSPVVREYEAVVLAGGGADLQERAMAAIDPRAIALFSIERGAAVRDVYAVTTDAQVLGVFGPSVAPAPGPHLPASSVATDAALLAPCDAGQAAQLVLRVVTATDKSLRMMPAMGGAVTPYHGISTEPGPQLTVRDTGCVTELAPDPTSAPRRRQAAIVDVGQPLMPRAATSVVFECDPTAPARCRVDLPSSETGAGLSAPPRAAAPAGAPAEEPRVTGMYFDASGVIMSSWVLLPIKGGSFLLVERERVPSASIPGTVVSGHFDGDGRTDLLWDLQNANLLTSALQVTYGRTIGAQRLSALSGTESVVADAMLAGELTGDGADDLVLFGRQRTSDGMTATGLAVVPMNVPIPTPDRGFDRPCP